MGLRDDDLSIYEDRAILEWAEQAPEHPSSYDYQATKEQVACHEHAVRKWLEKKPKRSRQYPDR